GLFNIFRSVFFRSLLALLSVSIIVCTARRWRGIWNATFHTRVRMNEGFLVRAKFHAQWSQTAAVSDTAAQVRSALARAHYHVRTEVNADSVALFAEKNRFSRFGTFLSHLGLVLILAGAVAGGLWGFSDSQFVVAEGSTRDLGLGTNIAVRVDRSIDEYYADGRAKDLRSDLTIFADGKPVKRGTVLVNSPLRYDGIAFHESFYGQAFVIKVQDADGKLLYREGVPLAQRTNDGERPLGKFDLPDSGLAVYITGPIMGAPDSLIHAGQVRIDIYEDYIRAARPQNLSQGVPAQINGLVFTFEREGRFTGLNVVKDPGTTVIWFAGGFMILGMVMLFYLPPKRLWGLCTEHPDGTVQVTLGMPAQRSVSLGGEFAKLSERVSTSLGTRPTLDQDQGGNNEQPVL
ncbi:MAG: cytochrome c biogenesis protein ResB, partial [Anaerolineaceae bacterium]